MNVNIESHCCVCNDKSALVTCKSSCGNFIRTYCTACLQRGLEPYEDLINMRLYYDNLSTSYKQKILLPSLQYYNKTRQQYDSDIDNLLFKNDK